MLNEERVKHMVKLASYENRHGEKEIKINAYKCEDYVKTQVYISCIWVTVGYVAALFLIGITCSEVLLPFLSVRNALIAFGIALLGYILFILRYIVYTSKYYRQKHMEAKKHVKQYLGDLVTLESMYQQEES